MDISIVSGTYNRINSLIRMVESARHSFTGYTLQHEFVLVDGGSQDGTQAWCRNQSDVRLIEHGELLGAIRAFNDGAFAAQGDYVVLANDDIEFAGKSILTAWLYMQTHPDCGIGCFYQNRNGRDWHVEEMPCVEKGKQVHRPYGQVCIVPKWLGDRVYWWGQAETFEAKGLAAPRTYGGDNELSANVYELGFRVSPVPEARVIDHEAQDDLRKINNITGGKDPRAVRGHHPDSWSWGRKWKDPVTGLVGPVIKNYPLLDNPLGARQRIMYLPIYEQGWPIQKEQKRGLREALSRVGLTMEFDYIEAAARLDKPALLAEILRLMREIQPTLFLSQLHNGAQIDAGDITLIRQSWPETKFVNWNGDYWPENLLSEDGIKLARAFDLQLTVNRDALEKYRALGVTADYWQIGYEPDGVGCESDVAVDVVFLGSGYSAARQTLVKNLRANAFSFALYGTGWPEGWTQGQNLYNFSDGCRAYRSARISIGDSQWPETGFVSNRVFQALAAGGAALAHQWFRGMEQLGLIDGETCIIWRDWPELRRKIGYYLDHEEERRRVAGAGQQMCLARHSFDMRVAELLAMLKMEKAEEGWRW